MALRIDAGVRESGDEHSEQRVTGSRRIHDFG
jgi:hypothetical protein